MTTLQPEPVVPEPRIDLTKAYCLHVDFIDGQWRRIPVNTIKYVLSLHKSILLTDYTTKRTELIPEFVLESYIDNLEDSDYKLINITGETEPNWLLPAYTSELLTKFHYTWFNRLTEYLHADEFKNTLRKVKDIRSQQLVFPEKQNMFTPYLQSYDNIKSVWLTTGPYRLVNPKGLVANGFAFATYQNETPYPLDVLKDSIRDELGLGMVWDLDNNLKTLIDQGVLLLNIGVTATSDRIHTVGWKNWTQRIVKELNLKQNLSWVLFGDEAQTYKPLINSRHSIYETYDPMQLSPIELPEKTKVFKKLEDLHNLIF